MYKVDVNSDLGESFGVYRLGSDERMLPLVSSVNIACGFHAGDPAVMRETIRLSIDFGAAIGSHPGLPDLQGFGRRKMAVTPSEAYDLILYQTGALCAFARAQGASLHHVKPHGALYNMAAADKNLAGAIAEAIARLDSDLVLYGLSGSELVKAGRKAGLRTASEVFADRTYQPDGSLTPRNRPEAMIVNPNEAASRAVRMVTERKVRAVNGEDIDIEADTICVHGDGSHAVEFAIRITSALNEAGIKIAPAGM